MAETDRNRAARRTYKGLTPGEYAGHVGKIKVGEDGTFSTTKRNEQLFVENSLGWEGTEDTGSSSSKGKE